MATLTFPLFPFVITFSFLILISYLTAEQKSLVFALHLVCVVIYFAMLGLCYLLCL